MTKFVHEGYSLHYEVHGEGRPVVLLHGITVSFAGNYAGFGWIERLRARGLQVIGLDFRGHGKSDKPHDPAAYGSAALAGDVIALLGHLGIARASLIGYSLGSMIALHLLQTQAACCDRSVLIATGDGLIGLPPFTAAEVNPRLQEALDRPEYPADLPVHVATYWMFATRIGGDRLAAAAAARGHYPVASAASVAHVKTPVLVISGEKDPVLGTGAQLAAAMPQARYVEIAGADHFQLSTDERAQSAVADFLAETAA